MRRRRFLVGTGLSLLAGCTSGPAAGGEGADGANADGGGATGTGTTAGKRTDRTTDDGPPGGSTDRKTTDRTTDGQTANGTTDDGTTGGKTPDRTTVSSPEDPSTPNPLGTTCDDPPFGEATAVEGTANTSVRGNRTGFRYDVEVENDGTSARTVAVRIAERTGQECDPLVFEAVYHLAPGAETVIRDPVGGEGEYVLVVAVEGGRRTESEFETHGAGIGSATAALVSVSGDGATIRWATA